MLLRPVPTARQVFTRRRCAWLAVWFAGLVATLWAADAGAPLVGPGATREEAINAYGWPTGQSHSGTKEILTYPQGRIVLENGKVEKVDFDPRVPWPTPKARPAPPSPTSVKKVEQPTDFWVTNFAQAQKEATGRHARILALFLGSDWSPPSKQFQDEVALHPDFVNAFTGDFVFLRLDFPTRALQTAELKAQNARLRALYGVTTYPSLLVLSPAGTLVGTVDLTKPQPGDSYRARTIAAIRELRDLLVAAPPPPDPEPVASVATTPMVGTNDKPPPNAGETSVSSAAPLVIGAIVVGLALAGLAWWLLWRKSETVPEKRGALADRISDAASGVPAAEEISTWSKDKLRAIFEGLVAADGYQVAVRDTDGDLVLTRAGETKPSVIVTLQSAEGGQVSAKRLKELFGTITIEDVPKGWFVAPRGFTKEAHAYAEQHPLVLIDGDDLLAQMRALPQITLQKILARVA